MWPRSGALSQSSTSLWTTDFHRLIRWSGPLWSPDVSLHKNATPATGTSQALAAPSVIHRSVLLASPGSWLATQASRSTPELLYLHVQFNKILGCTLYILQLEKHWVKKHPLVLGCLGPKALLRIEYGWALPPSVCHFMFSHKAILYFLFELWSLVTVAKEWLPICSNSMC